MNSRSAEVEGGVSDKSVHIFFAALRIPDRKNVSENYKAISHDNNLHTR